MKDALKKLYSVSYYVAIILFAICTNFEFNYILHKLPHFIFFGLKFFSSFLLLFKLIIDLKNYKGEIGKKALILFVVGYLFFTVYITKILSLLNLILLLICFKNVDIKKVLKIILYINLSFLCFNIIYSLFLLIFTNNNLPVLNDDSNRRIRYLINYIHPNSFGAFFSSIILIKYYLLYIKENIINKKRLILYNFITLLLTFLFFYLTDSKTMLLVIIVFLLLFNAVFLKKNFNVFNFLAKYSFIFISMFLFGFLIFGKNINYSYYAFFDRLLSGRLSYAIYFSKITNIHFFPSYTPLIEMNQLIIDSFYCIYSITYGFSWLLIFSVAILKSIKKIDNIEKIYIIVFSLIGIVEKWNINIILCFVPLIVVNALYNKGISKIYKDRINIAYIFTALSYGGVEQSFYTYLSEMKRDIYNITIITQGDVVDSIKNRFEKLGAKIYKIPSKKENFFKHYKELNTILKNGNFDVFHCNMTSKSFYYLFLACCYNIKLRIAHSHGFIPKSENIFQNFKYNLYNYLTCKFSNYYLASSKEAGDFLFKNKKYEILPNGISCDKFLFDSFIRSKVRKKIKLKEDDILLGHIGRFEDTKNHEFMISLAKELIKKNKCYKFLFIGDGELKEKIVLLCKNNKLNKNIIFIDKTEKPETYYFAMDAFLFPSLHEGFGICVIEANCSGLSCICSKNVPIETDIIKENSYLELDINKWIDNISNMKLNDEEVRKKYNKKTKKTIYNIKNSVDFLEKIYNLN